jgi:hypothetical protein
MTAATLVATILGVATLLGGVAALWYFWDKIEAWRQSRVGRRERRLVAIEARLVAVEAAVTDLQHRAGPADPEVDETLRVITAVVGGTRHKFCPVCWGSGKSMLLQHEPEKSPPWRCAECGRFFPGGYKARASTAPQQPRVFRNSWMDRTRLRTPV